MSNVSENKILKKKFQPKKRKRKLAIVFDENARREFLTGFHKRKLQRKNKAKEELEEQLKAERKRIKAEAKEMYMKMLLTQKPVPELNDFASENIDLGTHSVSVTELSTAELAKKNNWIGVNEVQYVKDESEESSSNESDDEEKEVLGMEIKPKKIKQSVKTTDLPKNIKDVKKKIKKESTAKVKTSEVFKKKFQLDRLKNIKLKKRQERKREKLNKKLGKKSKRA